MLLAAAQFFATPFEVARNLETARGLVRQAAENGAQVVLLPALFNTGYAYTARLTRAAEAPTGETLSTLRALSTELGVVVAGGLLLREQQHVFSALAVAVPGGTPTIYRQRRVCLWERCYFEAGTAPVVVETAVGRLGLLAGWDAADPAAWEPYAGQVDAMLVASAAPRFHRAVLNFPLGRKVYLGQLVPGLMRQRDALDQLLAGPLAVQAARLGVPVAHAAMSGRFVTTFPLARLSFLLAGLDQPHYWPLAAQAPLASLRATFYGGTTLVGADGGVAARVDAEEGIALAELAPRPRAGGALPAAPARLVLPATVRLLGRVMRPLAAGAYGRNRRGLMRDA
jgi:predicted amidohydrolase